jgi:hypothetical protein
MKAQRLREFVFETKSTRFQMRLNEAPPRINCAQPDRLCGGYSPL